MRILVVDDEEKFARLVSAHLNEAGHETVAVSNGTAALQAIRDSEFDVVVTDLKMTPVDGLEVLKAVKAQAPETEVILMTAYGTVDTAVAAIRQGAYDFITKPFRLDELVLTVERIAEKHALRRENRALRQELALDRFRDMIGNSPALVRVRELVAKVAPSDASVLISGESGVGKELVARMIHRTSPRQTQPFVLVHAAALPETLLESELFGYERGAFTGATSRKPGRLELAHRGTLFLDEIGEFTPGLQVKLLRFLQEKTFVRLGGRATITVDARIIAATNRNLKEEIRAGRFREDLYYRLAVFPIEVPPLRERRSDIAPLARYILTRLGYSREPDPAVLRVLGDYDWPGNVRELENVLERAMILAGPEPIGLQHIQLPEVVLVQPDPASRVRASLPEMEKQMIEDALNRAAGNKTKAAKMLGITRRMLYTKLAKFGIEYEEE
ncbi:MAG: sigma-54 dependent transcriptional regulator [candidate division WOR-3 bacterium]